MNMNNLQEVYGNKENQAPEILEHRPQNGIRVDIFSLGKLLFNLVTGGKGFSSTSQDDVLYRLIIEHDFNRYWDILEKMFGINLSPEFKDLFIRMVNPNPD